MMWVFDIGFDNRIMPEMAAHFSYFPSISPENVVDTAGFVITSLQ